MKQRCHVAGFSIDRVDSRVLVVVATLTGQREVVDDRLPTGSPRNDVLDGECLRRETFLAATILTAFACSRPDDFSLASRWPPISHAGRDR